MTTKFHEMCDRCYSDMIVECDECEEKERIIAKLLEALKNAPDPDIQNLFAWMFMRDYRRWHKEAQAAIKEAE